MNETSIEDELLIIKLKIKNETSDEVRFASLSIPIFVMLIIYGGFGTVLILTIETIIFVIILSFVIVPVITVVIADVVIKYLSEKRFKKFLEGEKIIERK